MKTLRKSTLAIVTALGLASATPLTAAWAGGDHGPGMGHRMYGEHRMEMMKQRHAERMELLEYRLKLTPEQKGTWEAFKAAQQAHWESMRGGPWRQGAKADNAVEFFNNRVQFMEQHLTAMRTLAKAAGDLYATLSPAQKTVMDDFFTKRGGPGWGHEHGRGQPDDDND